MDKLKYKKMTERLDYFIKAVENFTCYDLGFLNNVYLLKKQNFSLADISKIWTEGLKKNNNLVLNLYINIPFCFSRCRYCRHPSYEFNSTLLKIYMSYLINLMNYYKLVFDKYFFETLYIGGGTPSILTLEQIDLFFSNIFNNFNLKKEAIITFECNPSSINYEKLKLLKSFGVNRISIGVQSMNAKVLKSANRLYQSKEQVDSAVLNAKKIGFEMVNVDLIFGLKSDNLKSFFDSCSHILRLKPEQICIYKYKPDFFHYNNYINLSPADYYKKTQLMSEKIIKFLENSSLVTANYKIIKNDNCIVLELIKNKELFDEKLDTDFGKSAVLGLGQFALSWLFNTIKYKEETHNFLFHKNKKYCTGTLLSDKYEMSRYIYYSLENFNSCIYKKEFEKIFNKKIDDVFADELLYLLELGKIKNNQKSICLLPQNDKDRLIYSMFFLDKNILKYKTI